MNTKSDGELASSTGTTVAPSETSQRRTSVSCLNCRIGKVKCDEVQPKCSRCLRKGLDCKRSSTAAEEDEAATNDDGFFNVAACLKQIRDPFAHFREYAGIFVDAVKELQKAGVINRNRAINTLRSWTQENDEMDGFDMSWGAIPAIMETLGITKEDFTGPVLPEFPSLGNLPRASLDNSKKWHEVDFSETPLCKAIDPSEVAVIGTNGRWVLWVSRGAERATHTREIMNRALEQQRCFGFIVAAWLCLANDRKDLMQVHANHLFGNDLSSKCIVTTLDYEGKPFVYFVVMRHVAVPQLGVVVSMMTHEPMPTSRYTVGLPQRPRHDIIDSFRPASPSTSSSASSYSSSASSLASSSTRRGGGAQASTSSSSSWSTSSSSSSSSSLARGGRMSGGGDRGRGGGHVVPASLPMTAMGQAMDFAKIGEMVESRRKSTQAAISLLRQSSKKERRRRKTKEGTAEQPKGEDGRRASSGPGSEGERQEEKQEGEVKGKVEGEEEVEEDDDDDDDQDDDDQDEDEETCGEGAVGEEQRQPVEGAREDEEEEGEEEEEDEESDLEEGGEEEEGT